MAYCTSAKLFLRYTSSIVPKAVTTKPISRFCSTFSSTPDKLPRFSSWYRTRITTRTTHQLSPVVGFRITTRTTHQQSPVVGFSKRYYHGVVTGPLDDPDTLLVIVLVGFVVVGCVLFGRFETIPYSKRNHFVILRPNWEKKLGVFEFNRMKEKELKGRILPDTHPETIRVRAVANDLIGALKRNLEQEVMMPALTDFNNEHKKANKAVESSKDNVVMDDMWIEKSRKQKGERRGSVSHLNGLEWEILVVDEPIVNAYCLPGGKIVVFRGLLNHCKSNAELATIIGHEVGHAIARHTAEALTKDMWLVIFLLVFLLFSADFLFVDGQDNAKLLKGLWNLSSVVFTLPFSRRMEMEADYIGLLLLASAGYDPMVAPGVYKKLSGTAGGSAKWEDYLSTHPSGEKRVENLSQAKVMEEALSIYRDVKQGRGVKGFL
ncbi:hypothetical protein ACLB2K_070305 [Fragaria x ananassa]